VEGQKNADWTLIIYRPRESLDNRAIPLIFCLFAPPGEPVPRRRLHPPMAALAADD
jgi:hypothetical protein